MRLVLRTTLPNQQHARVFGKFNQDLFLKLSPKFPPARLLRFDGCHKGDLVQLELNLFGLKQRWDSEIVDDGSDAQASYFVDRGTKLPFFLSFWEHHHIIRQEGEDVVVIDDIRFRGKLFLPGFLTYPILFLIFNQRKPIYRKELIA